ncbi:MAG: BspA family leucine-rich repeat surface protein [Candidatus Heimdallarchaeota archaeon]|nr:BspA family leucine-rich repeat surface protein [Candidatus Heimdallarchaeota archaeon]
MKIKSLFFILMFLVYSVMTLNVSTTFNTTSVIQNTISTNVINQDTFITKWNTASTNTISLPLESTGIYNFVVDWGDGTTDTITTWDQTEKSHTYTDGNSEHTVTFNGNLSGWRFNNGPDSYKIIEISQWGNMSLGNAGNYFFGCSNLVLTASDVPDLSETTNLAGTFAQAVSLGSTGNLNNWDVSSVTNMKSMFWGAVLFNQSLDNWDVSSVTNMYGMFYSALIFNQPIGNWNVSSVTDMTNMFYLATSFNQPIGDWNVSRVTTMKSMFYDATVFNQPIGDWNVSRVTTMQSMFYMTSAFNQPLGNWDVSGVTIMSSMFSGVTLNYSNYDHLLEGWSSLNLQISILFSGGLSKYTNASARQYLIDTFGWTIFDGGFLSPIIPEVSSPTDTSFEVNTVGNSIEWEVSDNNPDVYKVTQNNTSFVSPTAWLNGTITVDIDGIDVGVHNFTIFVYDKEDNVGIDSVIVEVYAEEILPVISTPDDITYEFESTGNEIQWNVGDVNPGVYNVTKDGAEFIATIRWTNGTITVNVDGLEVGSYTFIINVYDTNGNIVTDSVVVNVNAKPPSPIPSTPEFVDSGFLDFPLLQLMGITLLVSIMNRRRRSSVNL